MRDERLHDGVSSIVLSQSGWPTSLTGTLVTTDLVELIVPPLGPNSSIRLSYMLSATNNANSKQLTVRYGGTVFHNPGQNAFATVRNIVQIYNRGSQNAQVAIPAASAIGINAGTGLTPTTGAVDSSVPQNLLIQGTLTNIADVLTLEAWTLELLGYDGR